MTAPSQTALVAHLKIASRAENTWKRNVVSGHILWFFLYQIVCLVGIVLKMPQLHCCGMRLKHRSDAAQARRCVVVLLLSTLHHQL